MYNKRPPKKLVRFDWQSTYPKGSEQRAKMLDRQRNRVENEIAEGEVLKKAVIFLKWFKRIRIISFIILILVSIKIFKYGMTEMRFAILSLDLFVILLQIFIKFKVSRSS